MEKVALLCVLVASILAASSRTGVAGLDYLTKLCRSEANLLARRMVAVGLDLYELRLSDPALVRKLQKQCTLCESRECCLHDDLAGESRSTAGGNHGDWREYCRNASVLEMLIAT
jgi:hypothetical protein